MNRLVHGTSQTNVNASPWLSIVGQPLAYHDSETKIDSWYSAGPRDSFGFASRSPSQKKGKVTISYTTGAMIEPQSHLGSTSHGAFGTMSAGTFLTGIEAERPCGTWSCKAAGSLGVSLMRAFRRLDPVFDTDVCILVQLASDQRNLRIRPLRRTVTTASSRIRLSRNCVSIGTHPGQEDSDRILQSLAVTGWPAD